MERKPLWIAVSTTCIVSMLLTSCAAARWVGLGAAPPAAAPSGKLTSSGFNCPEPNPRVQVSSTALDLYVWSTYIPTDFFECFQLVYGVEVKAVEYSSMEEMRAGLEEAGSGYDLIQPTDFGVPSLIHDGLLAELDHSRLPILANFNEHYLNLPFDPGNQYTVPYETGTDAIAVNTAAVQDAPNSWTDLWRPEYAGRIALADDERTVIGFTLLTLGYDVNTTNASELEQARRALLVLQPGIKVFDSDSPSTRLLDGEIDLAETWTGEAFLAWQQDPAMEYVYPTEGPILWQDNWAMLAEAPHPDAAYAWLNYTMQGDMFWMMLTNFPYSNPNEAALAYAKDNPMQVTDVTGETTTLGAVYETYMKSSITNPPSDIIRQGHRISDVGDAISIYDAIWAEVRGSE